MSENAGYSYEYGDGTKNNPYIINNLDDLLGIKYGRSDNYKINNNIDIDIDWSTIGPISFGEGDDGEQLGFSGTLDGNDYEISGLNVNGLFDYLDHNATLKNLVFRDVNTQNPVIALESGENITIENCQIYGYVKDASGFLKWPVKYYSDYKVDYPLFTIKNCKFEGTIENGNGFFESIGYNVLIEGCEFNGTIINGSGISKNVFGTNLIIRDCEISGIFKGTSAGLIVSCNGSNVLVENCHVDIDAEAGASFGGMILWCFSSPVMIKNCSFTGIVDSSKKTTSSPPIGGICGQIYGTTQIIDCEVNADFLGGKSSSTRIGGIFGGAYGESIIENCKFNGTIESGNKYANAGGICGQNYGMLKILNCDVKADFYILGGYCGGIAGTLSETTRSDSKYVQIVENCTYEGIITDYPSETEEIIIKHFSGLVSYLRASRVSNCISKATITTTNGDVNGMFSYFSNSTVENSAFIGELKTEKKYEELLPNKAYDHYSPSGIAGYVTATSDKNNVDGETSISKIKNCFVWANIESDNIVSIVASSISEYSDVFDGEENGYTEVDKVYFKGNLIGDNISALSNYYYKGVKKDRYNNIDLFYLCDNGDIANDYGENKTANELKNIETFSGWDFENTWKFGEDGFPILSWMVDSGAGDNQNGSNENKEQSCFIFIM